MATLLEKANTWLDLVCEDVETEIEKLPDADKLPTEDEAVEILSTLDKSELSSVVAKVADQIQTVEEATARESIKSIVSTLKGIVDPKVVMAVLTLMGAYNTAEASKFTDTFFYNQEHIKQEIGSELKAKIMAEFDKSPTASEGYAHVVVDGKNYFVGIGKSPVSKFAKDQAENKADKAALKANISGDKESMKLELMDYTDDDVDGEREATIIMGVQS